MINDKWESVTLQTIDMALNIYSSARELKTFIEEMKSKLQNEIDSLPKISSISLESMNLSDNEEVFFLVENEIWEIIDMKQMI